MFRAYKRNTNSIHFMYSNMFISFIFACEACNFIKKRLRDSCFPVNLAKFQRTPFLTEHFRWLLLLLLTQGKNLNCSIYLLFPKFSRLLVARELTPEMCIWILHCKAAWKSSCPRWQTCSCLLDFCLE